MRIGAGEIHSGPKGEVSGGARKRKRVEKTLFTCLPSPPDDFSVRLLPASPFTAADCRLPPEIQVDWDGKNVRNCFFFLKKKAGKSSRARIFPIRNKSFLFTKTDFLLALL